ncbi:putative ribosomal RNA large subunit methyltransferase I [Besnoitia besnoiti]|uniref:Putative ribosomal RNA large subunit methyltransferase I n=1 Tax=Besnoitia besnoiti TaxID=94643 RepID=A0A2A9MHC7_BESBE|nr:putative ribosomal RNA large subunit methyltransferase I [Besnoitia besnoiti]PFH34812.1 putative ribosomal RNA large subunit methyltransferase I [Besnoitia besnoiti]
MSPVPVISAASAAPFSFSRAAHFLTRRGRAKLITCGGSPSWRFPTHLTGRDALRRRPAFGFGDPRLVSEVWPRFLPSGGGAESDTGGPCESRNRHPSASPVPGGSHAARHAGTPTGLIHETVRGVLVLKTPAGAGATARSSRPSSPWIFSNEVASCSLQNPFETSPLKEASNPAAAASLSASSEAGDSAAAGERKVERGALVRLQDEKGNAYGIGYYNRHALISARVLTDKADEPIDQDFFLRRFRAALQNRIHLNQALSRSTPTCRYRQPAEPREHMDLFFRLVNGEADGLPGLIVDLYGDYACVQSLTRGMDMLLPVASSALRRLLDLQGILVRRDLPDRALEFPCPSPKLNSGDSERVIAPWISEPRVIYGNIPDEVTVAENGCLFPVDMRRSPETGWRFDRREFRKQVTLLSQGNHVLELFGHSSACSLTCLLLGKAKRCVVVDSSPRSMELARRGMEMNGITSDQLQIEEENAEAWLESYARRMNRTSQDPRLFDIVVLDTPTLAYRKSDLPEARATVRRLVEAAALLTAPRGYMAITNSSRHYSPGVFLADVSAACAGAGRSAVLCAEGGAGFDFPCDVRLPRSTELQWAVVELSEP